MIKHMISFAFVGSACLILIHSALANSAPAAPDPSIAYFGDSETGAGIGPGLTCISRNNMTAYTNASTAHYLGTAYICNLKEPFGTSAAWKWQSLSSFG